ncbi:MAG: biopolymer transporter ExbD [Planctomycetes bacterium]|nr:biopolymer transporter ExbD [Planctomycetota bacterium]
MPTGWQFRREESQAPGMAIPHARLVRAIEESALGESDEVRQDHETAWTSIGEHPVLHQYLPPGARFRARASEEAEMDMTPMIDVTFQLLIFFMIAATYVVQKTLDMAKAESDDQTNARSLSELEKHNILVKIAADRSITVQGKPIGIDALEAHLAETVRQQDKSEMLLDAADDVDHETIVRVIDAAGGAQIEKVHFVSRAGPRNNAPARAPPSTDK